MKIPFARKGTLAVTVGALLGLIALPAVAAPGDEALIPPGSTGSITVHKFTQPPTYGDASQGMELPASEIADLTPMAGATFQIRKVTEVDLSTNAGWQKAQSAVDEFDPFEAATSLTAAGFGLASPQSQVTGGTGIAQFSKLPIGLYLVEETSTPEVLANEAVTPAMPFLITVPLTDPSDLHQWVYNVHAYPKNVVSSVEKSVEDAPAYALGQTIDYAVDATIPGGSVTTTYVVTDQLDPKLAYVSSSVLIDGVATTDFVATHSEGLVTVSLGASARQAAFDALGANPDAKVTVGHKVTVVASGEITNEALLTFQREGEPETEVPSTPVDTKWGGINVHKYAHGDLAQPLAGAVFQVRAAHVNDFSQAKTVTVAGKDSWTTGPDGNVVIDGLRYSGFADGATVTQSSGKYNFYWLVETKAPVGYELLAQPIPFAVDSPVATAAVIDVANSPHNVGGTLPLTGASGIVIWGVAGVAVFALGVGLALHSRRRDALPVK